jgi:two-component system, chemotaxis family, sensor kinase CheA
MSTDPYRYFRVEARELIDALMQGVLDLEKWPGDGQLVPRLLRHAHTLKSAARVVKQTRIAELSHFAEGLLGGLRDDPAPVSPDRVRELLASIDEMSAALAVLGPPATGPAAQAVQAAPAQSQVKPGSAPEPADERLESVRVDVKDVDILLRGLSDLRVHLSSLSRQARALEQATRRAADESLGEIHRAVSAILERSDRQLDELDEQGNAMRLVPANSLFPLLARAARDAADATGKQIAFDAGGGEVRLDAHGLMRLRDALVHIVRNAVTHGVELPAARAAAGKPVTGRVQIEIERRGDRAIFRASDDGNGIDVERVRQVVVARRLVSPAEAAELTPASAMTLVLRGGITTSPSVSQLSGRGIGLDVVREAVASLGGTVAAWTEPGRGMRIELSVPVRVESREVLHLETGRSVVSIPREGVVRAVRLGAADIARSPDAQSIIHEGHALPFVPLGRLMRREGGSLPASQSVLILDSGARRAAVGVDHVLGAARVVIRSMPEILGPIPMILGAFLDSEGNPQLVLSVDGVIEAVQSGAAGGLQPAARDRPPVLVIDDSLTTRMLEQGILETAGYEVDTASSGEEALEKARQRRYGVFIVDVEMPGMDGFTFIQTARAEPELASVPSIVLTSRDSAEDRARGAHVGAKAYIVKSAFDEGVLLRTIRELGG